MLDDIDRAAMREGFAISKSRSYRTARPRTPQGVSAGDIKHQANVDMPMITLFKSDHRPLSATEVAHKITAANAIIN